MATFSTNQTRHFYVATETKSNNVISTDAAGSIAVKADNAKNHVYFEYMSSAGLTRSDLIDIKNVMSAVATDATKMQYSPKAIIVSLDKDINGGSPIAGQDYILRIAFRQYIGMSDADQYFKYGMVHAYTGLDASGFYKKLAISLAKNFSRENTELVKFSLVVDQDSDPVAVTATTKEETLTGTYTGVLIDEVPQPWVLGKIAQVPVYFEVQPTTITVEGDEVIWGKVDETEADETAIIKNGKKIADMEYFYMGERGDIYRGAGYPNDIKTTYLVDPNKEYHTFDIHYAYVGSNESVQKSEKTITIVCADKAQLNTLIGNFNTATGLSVATL
jgi:hypothetical protein